MSESNFKVGSKVVFAKSKVSPTPGQRATDITPQESGDEYSYVVEKYWIVSAVNEDGTLQLRTRRGKEHRFPSDDPRLRKANLWERLFRASRFPSLDESTSRD
ncbi:MAG: hypothetical protein Aurels2KO_45730 [Aureliella sp.]